MKIYNFDQYDDKDSLDVSKDKQQQINDKNSSEFSKTLEETTKKVKELTRNFFGEINPILDENEAGIVENKTIEGIYDEIMESYYKRFEIDKDDEEENK